MERHREISLEVEKGICGAGKLKILRLLMKSPNHAFTRYEIGKTVPTDSTSIRRNLKTLVQINWVTTPKQVLDKPRKRDRETTSRFPKGNTIHIAAHALKLVNTSFIRYMALWI
jgi:hypothetical protein